jgi:GH24 family phage-related lysozyme (muramidase)
MHRDKNGNTPEADAYLIEYINKNLDEFKNSTPNIDKLPQEYADALFDVFYNVGGKTYRNSPNLQHALKNMDLPQIANNLQYGRLRGHKLRSADRKNILKGVYQRTQ